MAMILCEDSSNAGNTVRRCCKLAKKDLQP